MRSKKLCWQAPVILLTGGNERGMRSECTLKLWSCEKRAGRLLGQRPCFQMFSGEQEANACYRFSSIPTKGRSLGTCDPIDTPIPVCSHKPHARCQYMSPSLSLSPSLWGCYQHLREYLKFAWKKFQKKARGRLSRRTRRNRTW